MRAEVSEVSSSLVQNALLDLEAIHYAVDRETAPALALGREGSCLALPAATDRLTAAADACGGSSATASGLSSKSVCLV